MRRMTLALVVAVLGYINAAAAWAGSVTCGGTVETLSFHANSTGGFLMIRLSSMNVPVYFCDPENSWSAPGSGYSISAAACKTLYATFLSAKVSGLPITNMYFDGDAAPSSCNSWATWQSANVRHYLY
jgi:hypothetical protein